MKDERANPENQMTEDAIDREIQSLLAVEPSAQFVKRVKAHIAKEPSPAIRHGWIWGAAAVAVAAAVVMMVVSETKKTATVDMPPVAATINEAVPVAPSPSRESEQPRVRTKTKSSEPEVLFSPAETAAIHRFMYGMPVAWPDLPLPADIRADDSVGPNVLNPIDVRSIDIAPIQIEPLTLTSVEEGVHQ